MCNQGRDFHVPNAQDYSYVSCSLVMYENGDGGGGGGGGGDVGDGDGGGGDNRDDADANDSMSAGGGSNGSEFDDDSSWTEDTVSCAGTSSSSSGGSSSSGMAKRRTGSAHGGDQASRGKWLKSLWTLVDRMDGERKSGRQPNGKHSAQPVKTILRPPIAYKYVVGMSGLSSKVPVYPRRM